MTLTVTVLDEELGTTETRRIAQGDYVVIAAEPCFVENVHVITDQHGGDTHMVTIYHHRPGAVPDRRVKADPDIPQWEERRGRPLAAGGGPVR